MRTVHHSDLTAAARALLRAAPDGREALCREFLREADCADRYVRKLGKLHPCWGNGTLQDAARVRGLAAERDLDDLEYLGCIEIVIRMLKQRPRCGPV